MNSWNIRQAIVFVSVFLFASFGIEIFAFSAPADKTSPSTAAQPRKAPGSPPTTASPEKAPGSLAPTGGTTTDTSRLTLSRNLLFARLAKGFFEVREIFMFENRGKKTIVSKGGAPTLRFALPKSNNIRNPRAELTAPVQGLDPKNVQWAGEEILSTEPIPPGMKLVGLFYRLADEFGGIFVERPIVYGTPSFALLPEKDRVQVEAEGFIVGKPVKFQDGEYESYTTASRSGDVVRFALKAPDSGGGIYYFFAAGGGVFILGTGLAFWIRGRRKQELTLQAKRDELVRAIAALDDRRAQGEISDSEFESVRVSRFERLREISR